MSYEVIETTREALSYRPLDWQKMGLQQTRSGYGMKLTTAYMMYYQNKWRRVYCTCFSSDSTMYIIKGKKTHILRIF